MVTLTLSNYVGEFVSISRVFIFIFTIWILRSGAASDRFLRERDLDRVIDIIYQIVLGSVRSGTVAVGLPWLGKQVII